MSENFVRPKPCNTFARMNESKITLIFISAVEFSYKYHSFKL